MFLMFVGKPIFCKRKPKKAHKNEDRHMVGSLVLQQAVGYWPAGVNVKG